MIARTIRFTERFSYFLLKLFAGVGRRFQAIAARLRRSRTDDEEFDPNDPQVRVQSLSRLVVFLLATVVLLVVWSSADTTTNPIISIFTGSTIAAEPIAIAPQQIAEGGVAPISTSINTGGTALFSMDAGGQYDLFALSSGSTQVTRLTNDPAHDRFPAWSPDGTRIAFSSKRAGNWDLHILDIASGNISRLTTDLAYEGRPRWSPDGQFIVYEAYYNTNYDIYIIRANGTEAPTPLTRHPSVDSSPAWTTNNAGREMIYSSWREGNQELYLISLDTANELRAQNLTNTATAHEKAVVFSPDSQLIAYQSQEIDSTTIYTLNLSDPNAEPQIVGQGHSPAWASGGDSVLYLSDRIGYSLLLSGQPILGETAQQAFRLPGYAVDLTWTEHELPSTPLGEMAVAANQSIPDFYVEDLVTDGVSEDPPYKLRELTDVNTQSAYLSDTVNASFSALRQRMIQEAGWDFLGRLDSAMWAIDRAVEPGQDTRNWHMTGRAFSVETSYNEGEEPRIEVVRRQVGPELFWDVYVRAEVQDGSLGMPLDTTPWDLFARSSGDRQAYEQGGTYKREIPSGYYVNFTEVARQYGWQPTASDSSWYYNWSGILYWQYEKRDGLTWENAMRQVWSANDLLNAFGIRTIPVATPAQP